MSSTGQKLNTKIIVLVGVMGGISSVLMLLRIPFIAFLKMDFSDIPAVIVSMFYGPVPGILIQLVKNVLKVIFGSNTAVVGEVANFIIGIAFVIPVGCMYTNSRKNQEKISLKRAIWIFTVATISMTVVGGLSNYFVLIPFYGKFFGGIDKVVKLIPFAKDTLEVVLYAVTPFNLVKSIILAILCIPLYKVFNKRA